MKIAITTPDARTSDQAWQAILHHGGFTEVKITSEDTGSTIHLHQGPDGSWSTFCDRGIMLRF